MPAPEGPAPPGGDPEAVLRRLREQVRKELAADEGGPSPSRQVKHPRLDKHPAKIVSLNLRVDVVEKLNRMSIARGISMSKIVTDLIRGVEEEEAA